MKVTSEQAKTIGRVIRETAEAQACRLFKSERRGDDVLTLLSAKLAVTEVYRSLYLAGIPADLLVQIEPYDLVVEKFREAGFGVTILELDPVDDCDC